jgi:hypothetical protein
MAALMSTGIVVAQAQAPPVQPPVVREQIKVLERRTIGQRPRGVELRDRVGRRTADLLRVERDQAVIDFPTKNQLQKLGACAWAAAAVRSASLPGL